MLQVVGHYVISGRCKCLIWDNINLRWDIMLKVVDANAGDGASLFGGGTLFCNKSWDIQLQVIDSKAGGGALCFKCGPLYYKRCDIML